MHPRLSNVLRWALTASRILRSNGMPPMFLNHATRTPLKRRSRFPAKRDPGSVIEMGHRGSGPAITLKNSATSETVRAIGPETPSVDHAFPCAARATRPGDTRKPTTPQNAAGFRREPPLSLPSAIGTIPHARLTAAPPLEPPQVFVRSYGFLVAPKTGLNVWDPAPNSGVLVLPTVIAPPRVIRSTIIASCVGTLSFISGEPNVVRIPAVSTRSLCATGRPCSGPRDAPRAWASSALRAFSAACL